MTDLSKVALKDLKHYGKPRHEIICEKQPDKKDFYIGLVIITLCFWFPVILAGCVYLIKVLTK